MKKYGKQLMSQLPDATTSLLQSLCTDWIPKGMDVSVGAMSECSPQGLNFLLGGEIECGGQGGRGEHTAYSTFVVWRMW